MSMLLRTQKNQIFEILRAFDLNPSDFYWSEREHGPRHHGPAEILIYRNDDNFFFCWEGSGGVLALTWAPGDVSPQVGLPKATWHSSQSHFADWLRCLKREIYAPDLWANLEHYQQQLAEEGETSALIPATTNRPFSAGETKHIQESLERLGSKLNELFGANDAQHQHIEAGLRRLAYAAEHGTGRIDWSNQLVGFVMAAMLMFAANPEQVHMVMAFLRSLFSGQDFLP